MKKKFQVPILYLIIFFSSFIYSQEEDSLSNSDWNFNVETDIYFTNPFVILPIITADRNKLHLEARYNYEDLKTFSGWLGYNFYGGEEFEYFITPMVGAAVGRTDGIAPGLELTLDYSSFELYSESEYLFDFESKENNFFYSWTDLTYSPLDWLWFGISGQLTKVYQTEIESDRGVLIGGTYKSWQLNGYFYNLFSDDSFVMVALSAEF